MSNQTKIISLASLGGALEMFDFTIYAFFAHYISLNFFPQQNSLTGLLNTFAVFLVGYCVRPLGAIIFGHFGDRYGRKNAFAFSAFFMAITTLLLGFLPTYYQIGILAPILLIGLRILQGISVGGEIPGATVFTVEHLLFQRPGMAVGLIFAGITLGNVMSSILGYVLTHLLSQTAMTDWGWRIPFFSGFLLGMLAFWLRRKTAETPIFIQMTAEAEIYRIPFIKILQTALPSLLTGFSLTALTVVSVIFFLYLPSYPPVLAHYSAQQISLFNILNFISLAIFTALSGFYSDYFGRKKLMLLGTMLIMPISFCFIKLLQVPNLNLFLLSGIFFAAIVAIVNGCYARAIVELFPAAMRYSGMALAYNLGFAIFGGITPLLMTALYKLTENPLTPFYFLLFGYMITLAGVINLKADRDTGKNISDVLTTNLKQH